MNTQERPETIRNKASSKRDSVIQGMFDALYQPIWVIDPKSAIFIDANTHASKVFGYTHDEIVKLSVLDINEEISDEARWQLMTKDLSVGESISYFARLKCKSGKKMHVEITMSCQIVHDQKTFVAITRVVPNSNI